MINRAGMKFGHRECIQMPIRRFKNYLNIAVEYLENELKNNSITETD